MDLTPRRISAVLSLLVGFTLMPGEASHALPFVTGTVTTEPGFTSNGFETIVTLAPPLTPCLSGFGQGCFEATSRYSVLGTSASVIPAQAGFGVMTGVLSSAYLVRAEAFDLHGRLLTRVIAGSFFGDEFGVEATSCGPQPGSCVSVTKDTGGGLPFGSGFPQIFGFADHPIGGFVTITGGVIPFYLPVGTDTGIRMRLEMLSALTFDVGFCLDPFQLCRTELTAGFGLDALPPPGVSVIDPVPEPTTLLLFGTTGAGLAGARWLRRRRAE